MDLLSLTLSLRPLEGPPPAKPLPDWWGRAAHALFLQVIRQYNPALEGALHAGPGEAQPGSPAINQSSSPKNVRPFTVSSLLGNFPERSLSPQERYTLRLTALHRDVAAALIQGTKQDGPLAVGQVIELDDRRLRIEALQPGEDEPETQATSGWAAATSFQQLSAALLLGQQPAPRQISLQFASPTTFKTSGATEMHQPLPLPELVFGSLLDKWNAFAPLPFPPEARAYAAEALAISRFDLNSRAVRIKEGLRVGGVGEVTYTSLNFDRYWMSLLGVLAAFALFSGVGAGASMGLGQCRQVQRER